MKRSIDKIEELVTDTIKSVTGIDVELSKDMSLIDGGILDSMSLVRVVQTLQSELDVDFDFAEITLENFDSLEVMVPFLMQKIEYS